MFRNGESLKWGPGIQYELESLMVKELRIKQGLLCGKHPISREDKTREAGEEERSTSEQE